MEFEIGIGKTARRAYGFDEVAIVPSRRTRDPEDVSIAWEIDAYTFPLPMMRRMSAIFKIVDPFWKALPSWRSRKRTTVQIVTTASDRIRRSSAGRSCPGSRVCR